MAERQAEKPKPKAAKPKAKPETLKGNVSRGGRVYLVETPVSRLDPPLTDDERARLKRLGLL